MASAPVATCSVFGASGFTGALAASLLHRHPRLELAAVTARSDAGRRLDDLYPRYRVPLELTSSTSSATATSTPRSSPTRTAPPRRWSPALRQRGVRVVDLSADFRLRDLEIYERWYGEHGAPELLGDAVYGLTELYRDELAEADLVANPGCYPTATVLALAPLAERGAASPTSWSTPSRASPAPGGAATRPRTSSPSTRTPSPYGARATATARRSSRSWRRWAAPAPVTFVPHLLPLDQGELASCYVHARARARRRGAGRRSTRSATRTSPSSSSSTAPPGVRDVRDTNVCRISRHVDERTGRVLAFAAIDNLWKGAAGQAIQNLNLMLGLDETEGLL